MSVAPVAAGPDMPSIEIDGALVARRLGLAVDDFRRLMAEGRIGLLCERGTGEDDGTWRATFYSGLQRARMVVDRNGRLLDSA